MYNLLPQLKYGFQAFEQKEINGNNVKK